jgi:hypothetical protein
MENKTQTDLFTEILRSLEQAGALNELVLVGSWALAVYRQLFDGHKSIPAVRTTDIDFLIANPNHVRQNIDIHGLLCKLGFLPFFDRDSVLVKYGHPQMEIEFLCARSRGNAQIQTVPNLHLTAQALNYMEIASKYAMPAEYNGIAVRVPELPAFVLHKILIHDKRSGEKKEKDRQTIIGLGELVAESPDLRKRMVEIFTDFPGKWQAKIRAFANAQSIELGGMF